MSDDYVEVVKEYVRALKYHIDNGVLIKKDINKIHREVVKYIKENGDN